MKKLKTTLAVVLVVMMLSTSAFAVGIQPNPESEYGFIEYMMNFVLENFKSDIAEEEVTRESLMEGAYKGIFETLDDHSTYFDAKEYRDFNASTEGSFGGIGISVTQEGKYIEVISPIKGTPGDRANLKPGDKIIKVDGEDITSWELHEAVDVMRGEPGESVTLTINRNEKIFDVEIIRELIEITSVEHEVLEDNIGYLQIKQFSNDSSEKVKDSLFDLKSNNINGLIIDVRNNPGGYLDEVVEISDYFLDEAKNIVHVDYESQRDRSYISKNPDLFEGNTVILVNEGSASASEILTGALKDNDEGTVIGAKTYGKGTVQTVIELANGGAMKVTIAEYMTANRSHINGVGIEPDIEVLSEVAEGNATLKNSFVPMSENRTVYYGERSLNVYGLQQRLSYLGEDLTIDAAFGPNTLKALNKYQRLNNLNVTETITRDLIDHLNKSVDNYNVTIEDLQLKKAIEHLKEAMNSTETGEEVLKISN